MNDEMISVYGTVVKLQNEVALQLSVFLEKVLPKIFDDWWNKAVINALSFQQKQRIEELKITTLNGLDLAALLSVLDQNWYQLWYKLGSGI